MAAHPRLVVLSITGFGEGGPDGHRSGFDQIIQGEAGLMSITGPAGRPAAAPRALDHRHPRRHVRCLRRRRRAARARALGSGPDRHDVAARCGDRGSRAPGHTLDDRGRGPGRSGNHHGLLAPYGAFPCSDGWINIAVGSPGLWARFAPLVGIDPPTRTS
jgi:crotonobetainyl-CoA:carnitine CoA-transferase CaiB-like acyl-CoA transferase